jgi:ABC-type multidrug transport system fused ATPase/permease subunit
VTSSRATFFHYLGSHRIQLLVGVCLAAGSSLAAVVPPRFIGQIIDSLQSPQAKFDDILHLAMLIVLFAGLEAVLRAGAR